MFTEDLTGFFGTDDHAKDLVWRPLDTEIPVQTIQAILNMEFLEVDAGFAGVESAKPVAVVQTSQVTGVAQGDTIEDGATDYKVVSIQPDGTGVTVLVLEKQ